MKTLIFHWDEAAVFLESRKAGKRLLKQWSHTAKAFGVARLVIIGENIPTLHDRQIEVKHVSTYQEARDTCKGKFIVLIEGGRNIEKVKLPKGDIVFVVGSNYSDPIAKKSDIKIGIDAEIPLWDVVAAGIALHGVR